MNPHKFKAIECTISRGGFSDERVFAFQIGDKTYSGVASRRHMWDKNRQPIEDGEPPLGQKIKGFVAARIVTIESDESATVSIPDGEVIKIPIALLVDRPAQVEDHVSLGS